MDVTVVVGTFGADEWRDLAMSRAIPSVGDAQSVHVHGDTLAAARNEGLEQVTTEWVTFLDADDELTPGYFDAMNRGTADLRAPAVEYVKGNRVQRPYVPRVAGHRHECSGECLPDGNWLVIGAVARTELVRGAGGFREWPVYEDWCLWLRCWMAGASVEAIPGAVYRAHVRSDSRNRAPSTEEKNRVHREIVGSVL